MVDESLYSSKKYDWETPQKRWDVWNEHFNFALDVAASSDNTKCDTYFTIEDNAFSRDWETIPKRHHWWANPSWGREYTKDTGYSIYLWVQKAFEQFSKGNQGVMLVPARTDTRWWHEYVAKAPYILFLRGRLKFEVNGVAMDSAPFPSALAIFTYLVSYNTLDYLYENEGWVVNSLSKAGRTSYRNRKGGFKGLGVS